MTIWTGAALGALIGCGSSSSSGGGGGAGPQDDQLALTAGSEQLEPAAGASANDPELARLGVTDVADVYELTTPAGEPFAFNVLARGPGNAGDVRVSVAHLRDGGAPVTSGTGSIAAAGVVPEGAGAIVDRSPWLDSSGDGFARLTLRGQVAQEQAYVVETRTPAGRRTVLVRVEIGPLSPINLEQRTGGTAPFVIDDQTLYSSDSWMFGLPVCATSGDRTTVVAYEGDDGDPFRLSRYEMRLQYDRATGAVTGGASTETSPDLGNWRDHEIAALFNVLAVAHCGDQDVSIRLSFDRGATFAQTETLATGAPTRRIRLVQVAMADDYTLATLFWRAGGDDLSELVLVEGAPSAFDAGGSPTAYAFSAPVVVHRAAADVTPAIMGAAYSEGGDLVIGYGYTAFAAGPNGRVARSDYRCAVRRFGETTFTDTLVDSDESVLFDPSVAVLGQGAGLEVFYAYETPSGIRLRTSADAGQTFAGAATLAGRTAVLPTVFAVEVGGARRVDVLYLEAAREGTELHLARWADFDPATAPGRYRLTQASQGNGPNGWLTTQVGWLGYDACLDGDDVVVVLDEHTSEFVAVPVMGVATGAPMAASAGGFTAATPPPLAPGLTTPLPAPDPTDDHQLRLLRLD